MLDSLKKTKKQQTKHIRKRKANITKSLDFNLSLCQLQRFEKKEEHHFAYEKTEK